MKIIIIAALLASGSCAHASDWVQVSNTDTLQVYLDRQSVAKSGKLRKAWISYTYKESPSPTVSGKNYKSTKSLELFSCAERTNATYQTVFYADDFGLGSVVNIWQIQPKIAVFSEVVPDSVGETMINTVCRISMPAV